MTRPEPPASGRAWVAARWAAAAVVLAGLAVAAAGNLDRLGEVDLRVRPAWWVLAGLLTAAASVALPAAWHRTVAALGGRLAISVAVRIWWQSQAARFVTTMAGTAAGRAAMAARAGVPVAVSAAAQVLELALLVGWSVALGAVPARGLPVAGGLRAALAAGAVAGLAALPWLAGRGLALARRWRPQVGGRVPPPGELLAAEAAYGANAALRSAAFVAFAAGMLPVAAGDWPALVAAWNLAAAAGILGITPAGLGVREGALVALLQARLGLGGAAALAAAWRAWELAFEVVAVAAVTAGGRRRAAAPERQSSTT